LIVTSEPRPKYSNTLHDQKSSITKSWTAIPRGSAPRGLVDYFRNRAKRPSAPQILVIDIETPSSLVTHVSKTPWKTTALSDSNFFYKHI
jgi:hypothetical protein